MVGGHWAKHRVKIMTSYQHPLRHDASELPYAHASLPGVTSMTAALNYILAVLYPQTQAAVADVATLNALVGNTINDFRVVTDDGDGKAAAYRWEQREGEVAASWHKIYDMDWGSDSILEAYLTKTQDLYVKRSGNQDLDASGVAIAGVYAGGTIYGGTSANSNLTLRANSGDGVGASTGYVQVDDIFRPAIDSQFNLGTNTERWLNVYTDSATSGTLTITGGSITDSSGTISFSNENLSTTGTLGAGATTVTSLDVSSGGQTLSLGVGSITDTTGAIGFGNENLSTTGTMGATSGTFGNITVATAVITSSTGAIGFDNENLSTTGTLGAGEATFTKLNVDNITVDGNTISSTDTNGNIIVSATGTGVLDINRAMETLGQTVVGTVGVTGQLNVDDLRLDGGTLSTTLLNANILLTPNGTGDVVVTNNVLPIQDDTKDLGSSGNRWNDLFANGNINNGVTSMTIANLLTLRDINVGAASGMTLFYDGAKWNASTPDTEIDHGTITGLADDDHTQYALLAGRGTGQTLIGGLAASNSLTLQSTAHGTRGFIKFTDNLAPTTTASYAAGWTGTNLGDPSFFINNIYSRGEYFGLRPENVGATPAFGATFPGRLYYNTATKDLEMDTGASVKTVSTNRYITGTVWTGAETTKAVSLVGTIINDARNCIIQLRDLAANNYEIIYAKITCTSATNITITVGTALPAGTYNLIVLE